jgi:hypothetical protein
VGERGGELLACVRGDEKLKMPQIDLSSSGRVKSVWLLFRMFFGSALYFLARRFQLHTLCLRKKVKL